jgi:hypothetical protein
MSSNPRATARSASGRKPGATVIIPHGYLHQDKAQHADSEFLSFAAILVRRRRVVITELKHMADYHEEPKLSKAWKTWKAFLEDIVMNIAFVHLAFSLYKLQRIKLQKEPNVLFHD